jgi:uncharacterized protein (DUF433 family)
MTTPQMETLTPAEAAVVASVSVRDVNRTIDEKILPEDLYVGSDRTRRFKADACTLIAFYFQAANHLTSEERIRTIGMASGHLRKHFRNARVTEWIVRDDFLSIDLGPFLRGVRKRLAKLAKARALVIEDPEILEGTPVIRGTRIPVYDIAASVAAGLPTDRILAAYPSLSTESIELTALYAQANPQRGRPARPPAPPRGAVIISRRRTARRKQVS